MQDFLFYFPKDFLRDCGNKISLNKVPRTCLIMLLFFYFLFKSLLYEVIFDCLSLLHGFHIFKQSKTLFLIMEGETIKIMN